MLERIALHQTRLRTPGLGLESKGVALGAKGLVLLPSLDRLVAWLSVYTREHSLEDLMPSLQIQIVRSKLGTREITLSFAAESSDRMDRVSETARLVGSFAFGTVGVHRLEARVLLQNGRANGALRKLGAVQEGVLRESVRRGTAYLDQVLWSVLKEDWGEHWISTAPRVH